MPPRSANPWIRAVTRARKELKITGFAPVKRGTALYALAKKYHSTTKAAAPAPRKRCPTGCRKST